MPPCWLWCGADPGGVHCLNSSVYISGVNLQPSVCPCAGCGAVQILEVAESLKLPIISDEIYGGISFYGAQFTPTVAAAAATIPTVTGAAVAAAIAPTVAAAAAEPISPTVAAAAACSVPIFTVSSISKTLLVPGWRLGWIALHDPKGILRASRVRARGGSFFCVFPPCKGRYTRDLLST